MRDFLVGAIGTMVIFLILGIGGTIEMFVDKYINPKLKEKIKESKKEEK